MEEKKIYTGWNSVMMFARNIFERFILNRQVNYELCQIKITIMGYMVFMSVIIMKRDYEQDFQEGHFYFLIFKWNIG
jgi:hypothetical protein